jgi:hypothetical protein
MFGMLAIQSNEDFENKQNCEQNTRIKDSEPSSFIERLRFGERFVVIFLSPKFEERRSFFIKGSQEMVKQFQHIKTKCLSQQFLMVCLEQ